MSNIKSDLEGCMRGSMFDRFPGVHPRVLSVDRDDFAPAPIFTDFHLEDFSQDPEDKEKTVKTSQPLGEVAIAGL